MIAQGFHAPNYRILETHINSQDTPPITLGYTSSRMLAAESIAPAVSAGESTLRVVISGVLLLAP